MNSALINNFNALVRPTDTTYMLGDFSFLPKDKIAPIREQLNGKVILIRGNHDKSAETMLTAGFDEVHDSLSIELDGYKLYLSHIPLGEGIESSKKYKAHLVQTPPLYDYFLCGHVHQLWSRHGNIINVGVDVREYNPVTLEQLLKSP